MADYHIFGLKPWGYHLSKILLHSGCSLLVFLIASRIIKRHMKEGPGAEAPRVCIPFAAALLFATHPVHTESVAVATAETSFAFFFLLSFYLYVMADDAGRGVPVASLVFFFLAALSKETALTLPVVMLAYEYSFKRDQFSPLSSNTVYRLLKKYLPYLVLAVIYIIIRTYAIGGFSPIKVHPELGGWGYFINVFPLFAGYLGKLLLPVNLNAAYVFHPISSVFEWKALLSIAVTLGFIAAVYVSKNRNRVVFFSLIWVALPLLPALYIPALGVHTFAERYLYLPSVGFVILASIGISRIGRLGIVSQRVAGLILFSAFFILIALYSAGTVKRSQVWHDSLTLWSDTVKKSPDSYVAHNSLGGAYFGQGRIDEAIEELRLAIRLKPDHAKAHNNLGFTYFSQGRIDEAIEEYKKAIRLNPDYAKARNNLGFTYFSQGRIDEAMEEYKKAISLRPGYADAHNNLGIAYYDMGRMDEAIGEYMEAIRLKPDFVKAYSNLGAAYFSQGRVDEAIEEYMEAIRLKPDFAEAHYNLGLAYAKKVRTDEAIREFEEYLRLNPQDIEARRILEGLLVENNHSSQ
jgi:tetratricopeptide (TPR) repeat protein